MTVRIIGLTAAIIVSVVACAEITAEHGVAIGLDDESPVWHDRGTRAADVFAALGALTVKGRTMRGSELGHADYDATLAGRPMRIVGETWLELLGYAEREFIHAGRVNAFFTDDDEAGMPVYADAAYLYHMHHSAGRFEEHGLYDQLTHVVSTTLSALGSYLLDELYMDGAFVDPDVKKARQTQASMAYGLDALHGPIYAWVRWHKPGGSDDMGRLSEEELEAWMGHDMDTLLNIVRALSESLDDAWDDDHAIYAFGGEREWPIDGLGAMIRGHKGLYEFLYMFGDDADRQRAGVLFDRAADMTMAILGSDELIADWGLPGRVKFENGVAIAVSDRVDVAAQWRFVHQVTGGFTIIRERESTSDFLETRRDDLVRTMGRGIDSLLTAALEYQIPGDYIVRYLDYADGSVLDSNVDTAAVTAFVKGVGNGYRTGTMFDRPGGWGDDADLAGRSSALYDAFYRHGQLLTTSLIAIND